MTVLNVTLLVCCDLLSGIIIFDLINSSVTFVARWEVNLCNILCGNTFEGIVPVYCM